MPIFEYICRDCHQHFETLVTADRPPACPGCHGEALDKQVSTFAVAIGAGPSRQLRERVADAGPCGSCGDPRGPGACNLN